jgi:hypothetical protein
MEKPPYESEREIMLRSLREHGLVEEPGPRWREYAEKAPEMTHVELREMLKGVPPLSEAIIEDREPR